MSNPPRIFISATSGDLRSARDIVKEALLTINCHPVEQTNFEPDCRTVTRMLRDKIADCQALIHIAGLRYGAEPDPSTLPGDAPRRSYTQMEYHLARELGLRVYIFVLPEGYPYDIPLDTDDRPMPPEENTKADLQRAYRAALLGAAHIFECPANELDLRTRILALQEKVLSLEEEQESAGLEVRKARRSGLRAAALVVLLLSALGGGIWWIIRQQERVIHQQEVQAAALRIDPAALRARLSEASERKLQEDLAAAAKESKSDDREKLRDAAQAAHAGRCARAEDLAARLTELAGEEDASPVLLEMARILEEPGKGVDAALAYVEKHQADDFERIRAAQRLDSERIRCRLQPYLNAAGLQTAKGDVSAARRSYDQLLQMEPDWLEALEAAAWFLRDQASRTKTRGSLSAAFIDAEAALQHSLRRGRLPPETIASQRVLSAALDEMADLCRLRGQSGDAEQALAHAKASLEIREKLLAADPHSTEAARAVSLSLERLADFLSKRARPGDALQALTYYQRGLEMAEKVLAAVPDSAQAARDLSVSQQRLADFLLKRAQPADAEQVLAHYQQSLKISQKLLTANPDSSLAARDVSVSLSKLGDFLSRRAQHGDIEQALTYYEASLEIRNKLLAANPDSAEAVRDLCNSLENAGNLFLGRAQPGDAEQALAHFQHTLKGREKLLASNPDSGRAARDVSISLNKLGDFLLKRAQPGDAEQALTHYKRSLEIRDKLLAASPDSAEAARDLSVSLDKVGGFLSKRAQSGDAAQALTHYLRGLEIDQKLLATDPDSVEAARDLTVSLDRVGNLLTQRAQPGDAVQALEHYKHSLKIRDKLLDADPDSATRIRGVAISHSKLARSFEAAGDSSQAKSHRTACYDLLHPRIQSGMTFDPPVMRIYEDLKKEFSVAP